jgi:thiol:disulfide interchange protein DsbC
MRGFLWWGVAASVLLSPVASVGYDKGVSGKDCRECHTLTAEEAAKLLSGIVEKVTGVTEAQPKGLWAVDVEGGGRKGVVYVDFSKKYLISGNVLELATRENLTQAHVIEKNRVDVSKIPLDDAVVFGKRDAKNRIIVFDDPECPYCIKLHAEVKKVVEQRDDVAFFIKMFPLAMHPKAKDKAKAILCDKEKAAQLLEDSFAGKELPAAACESNQVEENIKLAGQLGIGSTPTLVFPDGRVMPGFRPADKILEALEAKKGAGSAKPAAEAAPAPKAAVEPQAAPAPPAAVPATPPPKKAAPKATKPASGRAKPSPVAPKPPPASTQSPEQKR